MRESCDYCRDETVARHSIAYLKANYPDVAHKSVDDIIADLEGHPWHHPLADKVSIIASAVDHKIRDAKQRCTYETLWASPPPSVLGMAVDWKSKETVPISAVETSEASFGKSQLAVFCVNFFWLDNGIRQEAFCTAVSSTTTENSYCSIAGVKRSVQRMIDGGIFDPHQFDEIMMWCDTGRHFVSYEFAHYVCVELSETYDVVASLNYFAEKHGKSHVDGHFNCIGSYIKRVLHENDILTASDLVAALDKGYRAVKSTNESRGLPSPLVIAFVLTIPTVGTYLCRELRLSGLKAITCLQGRPDGVITLRENSACTNELSIQTKICTSKVSYTLTVSEPQPQRTPNVRASYLRSMQTKMQYLMNAGDPVAAYRKGRQ